MKKFSVLKASETQSSGLAEEHLEDFIYGNINRNVLQYLGCDGV